MIENCDMVTYKTGHTHRTVNKAIYMYEMNGCWKIHLKMIWFIG